MQGDDQPMLQNGVKQVELVSKGIGLITAIKLEKRFKFIRHRIVIAKVEVKDHICCFMLLKKT